MFSEIFQTFGEWLGTLTGITGFGVGLIASLMLVDYAKYLFQAIGMSFLPSGIIVVIAGPLTGFLIMLFSRFIAEQMRLLVTFVNNTKCIAANIKEKNPGKTGNGGKSPGAGKTGGNAGNETAYARKTL